MIADFYEWPNELMHRKGQRTTELRPISIPGASLVECQVDNPYTSDTRQGYPPPALSHLGPLDKLLDGQAVHFLLAPPPRGAKQVSEPKPTPVVILHGPQFGTSPGRFLISVIGKGSAVVDAADPNGRKHLADLVLAGLPSQIARALMNEFHRMIVRR